MPTPFTQPLEGLPPLLATPAEFALAAQRIAAGQGPIAIDTERASGFRYDDRAFVIQIRRRGSGTLLIDPEMYREQASHVLSPVLNQQDWVVHAAPSDLPSLAWLGFYPGRLFDTELAGRLAGLDQVNLAAMIEQFFDRTLAKGHGAEDWSQRPLPEKWLIYAALDVELLLELAEAMAEVLDAQGKLEWAEQEFEHIRATQADIVAPPTPQWRDTKGVGTLNTPEQLVVARELWLERESIAVNEDRAVSRILPNRVLVDIARMLPKNPRELATIRGFPARQPGATRWWFEVIRRARKTPRDSWPKRIRSPRQLPARKAWMNDYPESWERFSLAREKIDELGAEITVPTENLLRPATLRTVAWSATEGREVHSTEDLIAQLRSLAAREWQIELLIPLLDDALLRRR